LPDAKVGNIINTQIIPRFKQKDFEGGTLAGTKALIVVLESEPLSSGNQLTPSNTQITPARRGNASLWEILAGSGILAIAVGSAVYLSRPRKIWLTPEGRTRKSEGDYIFLCADCQQPMEPVDDSTVESYLSKAEQTAQKLGSVKFEGWRCPDCSQKHTGNGFHIVAQEFYFSKYQRCPNCQELTVSHKEKTIKAPTEFNAGTRLITDDCHCCSYHHQREEIIPRLSTPSPVLSSSWSSSSSGSGGSSSSSGGGDFGGGSSGGGGAGGDW
jgi:uncharacterized protein